MQTSDPQSANCVFCAIVGGGAPATFIHQDELVVAFMDRRPGVASTEARPPGGD